MNGERILNIEIFMYPVFLWSCCFVRLDFAHPKGLRIAPGIAGLHKQTKLALAPPKGWGDPPTGWGILFSWLLIFSGPRRIEARMPFLGPFNQNAVWSFHHFDFKQLLVVRCVNMVPSAIVQDSGYPQKLEGIG